MKSLKNIEKLLTPLASDIIRKITFIEQTLTYPEAMRSLTMSNLYLCAPEGDFILDQLNFFNQNNKDNIEMRGCASALFDGQRTTRSTYHSGTIIEDETLSIYVGSTGSKWSNVLMHINENLTTDGFHSRFLFHCLEPAAIIDAPRATTSYEQLVERRGAELEKFVAETETVINIKFGPSLSISNERDTPPTNVQTKLIISKQTCEEAVHIFLKIFMPQHFIIMNHHLYDGTDET
ncbi:unnamed protein product [Rotaria sp. Silwood2]|nr:unnamed protein product [Rotaria sp. Silwood2]CAF2983926.1 unnamed protein product [Rotaria sp. Silwood2]CAF3313079.1 unnamed protein product [Rotaria sp. Silwood2]CAF3994876.1 unnamed protein product [Rotaria sp. Silwood2]CAF4004681.1 unnamed protein product [Rotaria sp. Silwood2]